MLLHALYNVLNRDAGPIMQAEVLARYISDYNIKAIKFSPYEEGRLMTCGKDSVRMFRLKVCHQTSFGHPIGILQGSSSHILASQNSACWWSWQATSCNCLTLQHATRTFAACKFDSVSVVVTWAGTTTY